MGQIKVGLIGCGGISNAHAVGYGALANLFQVVATCDTDEEMARQRASQLGAEKVFSDYRDLLEKGGVDAVDICLPHDLHCPVAVDAARAGKHILVEKPIAISLEEADRMIAEAGKAGVKLMVALNERYDPANQKIKELVDSGAIGRLFAARIDHNQHVQLPPGHWIRSKAKLGGGVSIGSGIHRIDLMRWMLGEVREAAAFWSHLPDRMEGEVAAAIILKFQSGAIADICFNWAVRRFPWYEYLWIYGDRGSVHNMGGIHLDSEGNPDCASGYLTIPVEEKHSFTEEIRHFGECILGDKQPLTHGADARKSLAVVLAAYRSAGEGKVVRPE